MERWEFSFDEDEEESVTLGMYVTQDYGIVPRHKYKVVLTIYIDGFHTDEEVVFMDNMDNTEIHTTAIELLDTYLPA